MLDMNAWFCFEASAVEDVEATAADADRGTPALREVLVANYGRLHQRLLRHLGDADLASDCLHDAWVRLGDATHEAVRNPEAYVYRVACNLAMDQLRRNRAAQYTSDAEAGIDGLPDPAPGPELIAEARSDVLAVDRAIQSLPRRHRAVLVALRIDEMSRQEVASRYRLSLRGVDTALRHALTCCNSMH